jgi:DNA modification methylase
LIIHEISTADLVPYDNNPRHNEEAVEVVALSIKEFGFKVPIVIDKNNVIVTGPTRLKAALLLELEMVPCIMADDLTEAQIKAFRLADNKTNEYATWDMDLLQMELDELNDLEFDMSGFDFSIQEEALPGDDFDLEGTIEDIVIPTTKAGEVWQLGRHRLMCGDSTKAADFEKLMDGYKAKLTITDPPYNVNYQKVTTDMKIMNDHMTDNTFRQFLFDAYSRIYENMMEGAPIYVFHADTEGHNFRGAFLDSGFKLSQNLVWVKNSLVPGYSDYQWKHEPILYGWKGGSAHFWYGDRTNTTVYEDLPLLNPKKMKKDQLVAFIKDLQQAQEPGSTIIHHDKPSFNESHPTMKPIKLLGKLIFNSSEKGDLILDSFGGSGSTLIASEQSGRICYIMELDPIYCDVIIKRYEELTGQTAVRISG